VESVEGDYSMTINIEKERFEAWLESQSDDRVFDYIAGSGLYSDEYDCCVVCQFLKDTTNIRGVFVNPGEIYGFPNVFVFAVDYHKVTYPLPKWLITLLFNVRHLPTTKDWRFIRAIDLKTLFRKDLSLPVEEAVSSSPKTEELGNIVSSTEMDSGAQAQIQKHINETHH
jgi:hypothetical protein